MHQFSPRRKFMSDTAKYQQAIRAIAEVQVKGLQEHAKEMNADPSSRLATDPEWRPDMFLGMLEESLKDGGILEDIQTEVRKLLRTKVTLRVTMYEEHYDKLLEILHDIQKDSQKAGDEEYAIAVGEIADAISGGRQ
jgi:hypothetical protein